MVLACLTTGKLRLLRNTTESKSNVEFAFSLDELSWALAGRPMQQPDAPRPGNTGRVIFGTANHIRPGSELRTGRSQAASASGFRPETFSKSEPGAADHGPTQSLPPRNKETRARAFTSG